jgi:hypothetical protein
VNDSRRTIPEPVEVRSHRTDAAFRAGPGDYIRIEGRDLAFEADDARCGVFFVDGSAARSPDYAVVTPDLVVARVPVSLSAGPYLLRLRRQADGGYAEVSASQVFTVE